MTMNSTFCESNKDENFGGAASINKVTEEHWFTVSEIRG